MESHTLILPKKAASVKTFVKDETVIANDFHKFFCSAGQNTVGKIHAMINNSNCDKILILLSDQFSNSEVKQEEFEQIASH